MKVVLDKEKQASPVSLMVKSHELRRNTEKFVASEQPMDGIWINIEGKQDIPQNSLLYVTKYDSEIFIQKCYMLFGREVNL